MAEFSPRHRRVSLNQSTVVPKGMSLKGDNDSEDEVIENGKQLKLPEIVLSKLQPSKITEAFNSIPGLKTTKTSKSIQRRMMTEKKTTKREFSAESLSK